MTDFYRVEDLLMYQKLCDLHIEISNITHQWPTEERFELSSQVRRCSNSSPANLAENTAIATLETKLKVSTLPAEKRSRPFIISTSRYQECVRMLNGLERTLERQLDESQRRFPNAPLSSLNPEP